MTPLFFREREAEENFKKKCRGEGAEAWQDGRRFTRNSLKNDSATLIFPVFVTAFSYEKPNSLLCFLLSFSPFFATMQTAIYSREGLNLQFSFFLGKSGQLCKSAVNKKEITLEIISGRNQRLIRDKFDLPCPDGEKSKCKRKQKKS